LNIDFDTKVAELALETQEQLAKSERLIMEEREKLDLEECFYVGSYFVAESRTSVLRTLETYRKQLAVEKSFYVAFHNNYIKKLDALCDSIPEAKRQSFWKAAMPKLLENHEFRMRINEAKLGATKAALKLARLAEKNSQHFHSEDGSFKTNNRQLESQCSQLIAELDEQLELQYQYAMKQRSRYE